MMTEYRVLDNRLARAHGLKEIPQVWFELARGKRGVAEALRNRFFARRQVILLMPFLEIFLAQFLGEALGIIAWRIVPTALRKIVDRVARNFQNAFRTQKTIAIVRFGAEVQPYVDGMPAILEQRGVNIRHVAPVLPAQNPSRR